MNNLQRIILFSLMFLGTLAVLDIYLQLAEIQSPMETRIDPDVGRVYIPNRRIVRFNEGFFMGWANEYGYMGAGLPPQRVSNEKRILLLGDSFVLGHSVLPRHYFGLSLAEDLSQATGKPVHALNFGKADTDLKIIYQIYKDYAGRFDHDLALFFVGEEDLTAEGQFLSELYPKALLRGGTIVFDRSFHSGKTYQLYKAGEPVLTRSSVLRLLFNSYRLYRSHRWIEIVFEKFAIVLRSEKKVGAEKSLDSLVMRPLCQAIIQELAKDQRNCIVLKEPIHPELVTEINASGIPIIHLGEYLESLKARGLDPFFWPIAKMRGHWNHAAQPLIGRYLAEQILSTGILGPN